MNTRSCVLLLAAISASASPNLLSRLPLYFEPTESGYVARTSGYRLSLHRDRAAIGFDQHTLTLQFPGATTKPLEPQSQLPGYSNYLTAAASRTRVPHYERVKYPQLYPGIDLLFYGNASKLEYDFIVAPGADPSLIRLRLTGARNLRLAPNGDLHASSGSADLLLHAPVAYQMARGQRIPVTSRFKLRPGHAVEFELGRYDPSLPLTIDPVISFATFLGGTATDAANAIAVDSTGNVYVAGYTNSTDFPLSQNPYRRTYSGFGRDIFVSKINPTGNILLYSTYLGGDGDETPVGLVIDAAGNVTVGGNTNSSDFPQTGGTFQSTGSGMFLARMSTDGTRLLASGFLGGGDIGQGFMTAVTRDGTGNVIVGGYTTSSSFPVTPGVLQSLKRLDRDGFVAKVTGDLSTLLFSTFLGGDQADQVSAITADAQGNIYVAGQTTSNPFPATGFTTPNRGANDAFVSRINATGTALLASAILGGSLDEFPQAISIGPNGHLYVAGLTYSSNYPTTSGVFQPLHPPTATAAFLTKMSGDLSAVAYSTYFGSTGAFYDVRGVAGVHTDAADNAYLTGYGFGGGLPFTSGALQSPSPGAQDGFIVRVTPNADILNYASYLGGSGDEFVYASAIDASNNLFLAGSTSSTNFPVTAIAPQSTYRGNADGFVAKIDFGNATTNCVFTLSANTLSLDAAGGLGSVDVSSAAGCAYTATSTATWLTVTDGATGTGNGTVKFTVDANSTTANRTAQLRIGTTTFTVTQTAATCVYQIDPQNRTMPPSGGLVSFVITALPGCTWTSTSGASWMRLVSAVNGNGNGAVQVAIDENSGLIPRTGSLTIARQGIQILQPAPTPTAAFDDVALTHPFADYIYLMKFNGISDTCNNANQYCPEANTTRAQMALFIIRKLMNGDTFTYPTRPYFDDVGPSHPQFAHIQKMRELGITNGCTATTYCPDDSVTRGQMSAFIVRARLGIKVGQTFSFNASQFFGDVPSTDIFFGFVQKMKELGITSGCTATDYCPGGLTTRGQMAVFVVRALLTP